MQLIRQSTATTIYVGPVLDLTGAAVTTAVLGDFRIVKNGSAATLTGATVTHDANGYYIIGLTTTNTDTTGRLTLAVGNTAQSMSTHRYSVLLPSVFDALITNATNATGGLPTATGAITTLAGTIATSTNITAATGVVLSGVTHTGAVIPTVSDVTTKTGYSLSTAGVQAIWDALTSALTTVGSIGKLFVDNINATIGSRSTQTSVDGKPTLAQIEASAILAKEVTFGNIPTAVWGSLLASHTTADTFGARIVRSVNSNNTVQISGSGSNHIFAVLHDAQPNSIPEDAFVTNALSARVLAADFVSEIQSGLATATNLATVAGYLDTEIADIKAKTDLIPAAPASTTNITAASGVTVSAIGANVITEASIADGAINRATLAADTGLQNIRSGTAQAGAATTITLDAGASATTDFYKNAIIYITGGTGAGQARFCTAYNGTTKVATVTAWATNPNATSTFAILPFDAIPGASAPTASAVADAVWDKDISIVSAEDSAGQTLYSTYESAVRADSRIPTLHVGGTQGGSSTTVTLDASASSITNYYVGLAVALTTGTGKGQVRTITAYNGTTKVATVDSAWITNPSSGSSFVIVQTAGSGGGGTVNITVEDSSITIG